MITEKITCDICKAERGIDNHWLLVDTEPEEAPQGAIKGLAFFNWHEDFKQFKHICSADCAAKLITQTLLTKITPREITQSR